MEQVSLYLSEPKADLTLARKAIEEATDHVLHANSAD